MKHQTLVAAFCIAAGCTYNEYKSYYTTPEEGTIGGSDAGVSDTGRSGSPGTGGSSSVGAAGSAGSSNAGNGGSSSSSEDCTGCELIRVQSGRTADYQLDFDSRRNLSESLVLFRVRVRDYVGSVNLTAYIESGDHADIPQQFFAPESSITSVALDTASGWQDVGIDLQQISPFQAASFDEADGGTAGGSFNSGFPFDKSRVRRVGLVIQPNAGSGLFTPATLELDSVTFSTAPDLNVDFSTGPGEFELVDPESGSVSHVPA